MSRTGWSLPAVAGTLLLAAALASLPACSDDGASGGARAPVAVEAPLGPEDTALVAAAAQAMQLGRPEDVARVLAPLLARARPPVDAQFIAGSAAYDLGDYADAVTRLTDAGERKQAFVPNISALGFAQFKLGDFAGARATFERIVSVRDSAYKAHYGLGLVALSEGRLTDARTHLERSLAQQPDYLKARFQMARLLHEEGRLEEARAGLEHVLREWPSHEEALYRLSLVLSSLGRGEEAAAAAERHAHVYKARESIGAVMQRIRSGDDRPELHAQVVGTWVEVGDIEEAQRAMAAALRRFPGNPLLESLRATREPRDAPAPDGPPDGMRPPAESAPIRPDGN